MKLYHNRSFVVVNSITSAMSAVCISKQFDIEIIIENNKMKDRPYDMLNLFKIICQDVKIYKVINTFNLHTFNSKRIFSYFIFILYIIKNFYFILFLLKHKVIAEKYSFFGYILLKLKKKIFFIDEGISDLSKLILSKDSSSKRRFLKYYSLYVSDKVDYINNIKVNNLNLDNFSSQAIEKIFSNLNISKVSSCLVFLPGPPIMHDEISSRVVKIIHDNLIVLLNNFEKIVNHNKSMKFYLKFHPSDYSDFLKIKDLVKFNPSKFVNFQNLTFYEDINAIPGELFIKYLTIQNILLLDRSSIFKSCQIFTKKKFYISDHFFNFLISNEVVNKFDYPSYSLIKDHKNLIII